MARVGVIGDFRRGRGGVLAAAGGVCGSVNFYFSVRCSVTFNFSVCGSVNFNSIARYLRSGINFNFSVLAACRNFNFFVGRRWGLRPYRSCSSRARYIYRQTELNGPCYYSCCCYYY